MANIVISRLMCGLGNQLFQYAAAVGLARASGARIALDVSEYASGGQERCYALHRYDLDVPLLKNCSFEDQFRTIGVPAQDGLASLGVQDALVVPVCRQDNYEFEPAVRAIKGSVYLYGFWQSWKYFAGAAQEVRRRLAIPSRDDANAPAMMQAVERADAVAVHVRRGDYLSAYNQAVFGLCEPAYYAAAIGLIREQVRRPKFFIFSDDPEWCKDQFVDQDMTIVSGIGRDAVDDLALMARCRHHVIANSSLSWWGAWLGERPDSIIVAPFPWYTQSPRVGDLIPDRWIRLDRTSGMVWQANRSAPTPATVSAIVLARTGGAALLRALNSVRAQSHPCTDVIVVVCDNAGEATISVAQEWVARQSGSRLVYASRQGFGTAINDGLSQARGDWVAFLDGCDAWRPDKIEIQLEAAKMAAADVVSCRTMPIAGANGLPTIFPPPGPPSCSLPKLFKAGYFISGISHVLVRRKVAQVLGPFDDRWSPEDGVWPELWNGRSVMLWERLVESPIPYVVRPERMAATA